MATIPLNEPKGGGAAAGPAFFAAGFRPLFLAAALHGALMLPLWLAVHSGGVDLGLPFAAMLWHGHEMVFGFAGAAVGGFLLTAVPNWTGSAPVAGRPLMLLSALWLAGRLAFVLAGHLPPWLVAAADLAYLPLLGVLVGGPLVRAGKPRNMVFLVILALFFLSNAAVHIDFVLGAGDGLAAIRLGIAVVLVMIALVGGRVVPAFTQTWLRMQGDAREIIGIGWIEKGSAVGSVAAATVLAALLPGSAAAGAVLLAAAAIHLLRLARWRGWRTLSNPILWVLHLGYLWLVAGLALLGASSFTAAVPETAALHALTAGSIATMIIGVMSRAALGHSGRMLVVSRWTVAAYVLVSLGALLRVAAGFAEAATTALTHAGGGLWALGWVLFAVVYVPIVTRPRADGRPG
ncbi:NnrS family protein [Magnetospirillum sp. UT-4]|uniref:NnrS family protein n=1 Tax=Magnetospirillum sp. UT-4 TaxID=2681467 RepID=UPI00137CDD76|nr:NnrS family protein [Magnetospirillum sp. UT-4]CAA7618084.1 conserved membrane hypothetical protein [Magnetospirillum sp. UT-4]